MFQEWMVHAEPGAAQRDPATNVQKGRSIGKGLKFVIHHDGNGSQPSKNPLFVGS